MGAYSTFLFVPNVIGKMNLIIIIRLWKIYLFISCCIYSFWKSIHNCSLLWIKLNFGCFWRYGC